MDGDERKDQTRHGTGSSRAVSQRLHTKTSRRGILQSKFALEGAIEPVNGPIRLEESGAIAYAPLILEERARMAHLVGDAKRARRELENALSGYRAYAAVGHVARLETELGPR